MFIHGVIYFIFMEHMLKMWHVKTLGIKFKSHFDEGIIKNKKNKVEILIYLLKFMISEEMGRKLFKINNKFKSY